MTSARIVSDAFFFDFNHATCDGVKNTATRSVFFSFAAAIGYLGVGILHPMRIGIIERGLSSRAAEAGSREATERRRTAKELKMRSPSRSAYLPRVPTQFA